LYLADSNITEVNSEEASVEKPVLDSVDIDTVGETIPEPGLDSTEDTASEPSVENYTSLGEKFYLKQIRVRVSSKHLKLASRVFKYMLQVGFREGHSLKSKESTELPFPEDDAPAMLILLNLIHGKLREVPRTIDLPMLTEIAVLVDKYELLEITDIIIDSWLQSLKATIPRSFDGSLLPWLCISWVFEKPEIFKQVTKSALLESEGFIEEVCLPIPEPVLSMK
jgi:hypothetical protein